MKYYYFENGKVWLSYNKIPDNGFDYTTWFYSRLPCDIDESEIMKIYVHLFPNLSYNKQDATPIDITHIVFEKKGKIYFKKPQQFGNTEQVNLNIEKIYKCECGWKGSWKQMKREQDFGYDQSCCPKCNNVMFNNLHGEIHCEQVDNESDAIEIIKELLEGVKELNAEYQDGWDETIKKAEAYLKRNI